MKNSILSRIISSDISPTRRAVRKAMPALLLILACSLAPAGNSLWAKQTAADKAAKQQAKGAELTQKYGMNLTQIQQYEALDAARQKKVSEVNKTPGLAKKERKEKIKAIKKEFQASLDEILTPDQRKSVAAQRSKRPLLTAQVKPILKKYRKERSDIRHNKSLPNRSEALSQVDKKYENELAAKVGSGKAQYLIKQEGRKHNANNKDAEKYKLSYSDAQKYQKVKKDDKQRHKELDNTALTRKDRADKEKGLVEKRDEQVKNLFGESNLKQWKKKNDPNFDQKLKQKRGFSDQQIKQYKEILNQQAIALLKIRKGKGTKDEKQNRMVQAKAETDQKLQQILTPAQYSKMIADRQKYQNNKRRQTIKANTIKPAPKVNQAAAAKKQ